MIRRVLIVDDEPLARERLVKLIQFVSPGVEAAEAGNGDAAVDAIAEFAPELVLLDVQMPGRDGFEVVETVGVDRMPLTIFVTAFDHHAMRAFDVSAVDYLLKPFDDDRFTAAWTRVEARHAMREVLAESRRLAILLENLESPLAARSSGSSAQKRFADRVMVKNGERTTLVKLADVQWIEAKGNYVVLHAARADHVVRETLASIESRIDPELFVRIHRGTIVAIDAIRELQPWFGGDQVMILRDGRQLRVSRTHSRRLALRLAGEG